LPKEKGKGWGEGKKKNQQQQQKKTKVFPHVPENSIMMHLVVEITLCCSIIVKTHICFDKFGIVVSEEGLVQTAPKTQHLSLFTLENLPNFTMLCSKLQTSTALDPEA